MRIFIFTALIIGLHHQFLLAQEDDSDKYLTVLAEIQDVKQTGKRHNSYYFTFKIKKVFVGIIKDSIIRSQEIYHDFGGAHILSKIYPDTENFFQKEKNNPKEIIIKFHYEYDLDAMRMKTPIKWIAEKHRRRSLERLEEVLADYYRKIEQRMYKSQMIVEYKGKLFFGDDFEKVAIETRSGIWVIATVDREN